MNPLAHTRRVAIELSNICPLASVHTQCPLSVRGEIVILPTTTVLSILDQLGEMGFCGSVAFHRYNEPMADPRLFYFLEARRQSCPGAMSYICTCGDWDFLSDYSMFSDLTYLGVATIDISAAPLWDGLLGMYEAEQIHSTKPCFAPLDSVEITKDGDVVLCCKDWRSQHAFGNLEDHSLAEILLSDEVQETYRRLAEGDRFLDLCSRCNSSRGLGGKI